MRPDLFTKLALALAITLGVGCADEVPVQPPNSPPPDPTTEAGPPASPNPRVRFKGPKRLALELSRILDLDDGEVCSELGQYDCFTVHNVSLGGADPFGVALYSPSETSTATTPIAVERVVLAGCIERAVRDLKTPTSAVIFKDIATSAGVLDVQSDAVAAAIDSLYTRSMQRRASESEVAHLRSLYADVEKESASPAQDWASLSCFAVLTSLETLFY